MSRQSRKKMVAAWLIAMSIIHVIIVYDTLPLLHRGYQDFTIFYTAGRMLRSSSPSLLYDLALQQDLQRQFAPSVKIRSGPLPYNHPPFEALLFLPLAALSYWHAYLVWTLFNVGLLTLSLLLLRTEFSSIARLPRGIIFLAASGFFPVVIALLQGQDAVLLLALSVAALVCLARERDAAAGAFLALGLFKPQLVGPILLLLAFRRPRLLAGFVPVAVLLAGVSIAMTGWNGPLDYTHFVLNLEKSGAGAGIGTYEMPNLRGLISYLPGFIPNSSSTLLLTILASLAVFALALRRLRSAGQSISDSFGLATVSALLISYHSFTYDLSLLLPAAFLLLSRIMTDDNRTVARGPVLSLLALFFTPLYVLLGFRLSRLCWFALLLIPLFWVLYRSDQLSTEEA